ncbi:MAG TPA: glycosyltransferase [bacterium]|nr:glycosyltransferase [bacterium]HPN45096.1 glycosyltransferase [bacterium]
MQILTVLLCLLTGGYVIAIAVIAVGIKRLARNRQPQQPQVSVVVAARNEAENIPVLLRCLEQQDYPADKYEIIIVNDDSTDNTAALVEAFAQRSSCRVLLLATTNRAIVASPKKNALSLGIARAGGEIILLTDADCAPPPGWISGMVACFTPQTGMVIGYSSYELPAPRSIAARLLALDALSLAAVAAGTTGWGKPATCNGRNLAYRKSVYEQVGGFEKIKQFVSGDDDLFLKLVLKYTDWEIRYGLDAKLVVPTSMLKNLRQFVYQRTRHASKGFHYELAKIAGLFILYFFNVLVIFGLVFMANMQYIPLACYSAKILAEFGILYRFAGIMRRRHFLTVFPLAMILHPLYIAVFGALGQTKKFKWK